jgi:hypothetical protein
MLLDVIHLTKARGCEIDMAGLQQFCLFDLGDELSDGYVIVFHHGHAYWLNA